MPRAGQRLVVVLIVRTWSGVLGLLRDGARAAAGQNGRDRRHKGGCRNYQGRKEGSGSVNTHVMLLFRPGPRREEAPPW